MTIWMKLAAYAALIAAIAAAMFGAYKYIEQQGYDRCMAKMQAEELDLATAYAGRIIKAEGERDANQAIIDRNTIESRSLHIHIPTFQTPNSQDQNGSAGLAAARIDSYMEEAKSAIDAIGKRCAEMNLDAIKINAEISRK